MISSGFFTAATWALLNVWYSIIAVILTAYGVKGYPIPGQLQLHTCRSRSSGNFASERIACMRDVIHRERITCRTRRFNHGKIKNKHRAGGSRRKKRRIEGDLRSIKVSPSCRLPFPSRVCHLRSAAGRMIKFLQACRISSKNILSILEVTASRCSHYIHAVLQRHAELVNLELSNRSLPRLRSYIIRGFSLS